MINLPEQMSWLGDEDSWNPVALQLASTLQRIAAGTLEPPKGKKAKLAAASLRSDDDDDDDDGWDENPVRVEKFGDHIAVLRINGSTINETTWVTRYLGIVTYQDIKERLIELSQDSSVRGIVTSINSSGGQAEGMGALSKFIRAYSNGVKPIFAHTSSKAHSAAYWTGASAARFFMDEEARVGSIGAILVHAEYTEMFKQIGIKHTVFRSAPYKALGTAVEKLTPAAIAEIEKETMFWHNKFAAGIATMRGLDLATVNNTIANGRTYSAEDALKFRMVDQVYNFEEALVKLHAALDKKKPSPASSYA